MVRRPKELFMKFGPYPFLSSLEYDLVLLEVVYELLSDLILISLLVSID